MKKPQAELYSFWGDRASALRPKLSCELWVNVALGARSLRLRSGRSVAGAVSLWGWRHVVAGAGHFGFGAGFALLLNLLAFNGVMFAADNRVTVNDLLATAALSDRSCFAAGRLGSAAGRLRGAANRFRGAADGLRCAASGSLASVQPREQPTAAAALNNATAVVATMMAEQSATTVVAAVMAEQPATTVVATMMTEQSATTAMTGLDRFAGEHGAADQQRERHSNTNYITTHSNSLRYDVSY